MWDIVVRTVAEAQDPADTPLADICSHSLLTVTPTDSVEEAVRLMRTHAIRRLPVVEGGKAVGIVSLGDLAVDGIPARRWVRLARPHPTSNREQARPTDPPRVSPAQEGRGVTAPLPLGFHHTSPHRLLRHLLYLLF
jgi:CBS-domain-containing membrane protein